MLLVHSGIVVSEGREVSADVLIDGSTIISVAPRIPVAANVETVDATGCSVSPGFIDLQLNGAFGVDFTTSPEEMTRVSGGLPTYGVTSFCPTVISCSDRRRAAAIAGLRSAQSAGAQSVGIHLEGPVLNPLRRGAHPASALVAPSREMTEAWSRDAGVSLVTLAPELPGALDLIAGLVAGGVVASAGHSDATAEEFLAGVDAGIRYVTHLFNAMRPFGHRDPGIIGAALTDDRVTCGLIADGIHVHPMAVRLAWRALGPERLNLVTDAVAVLGAPGGRARVGDVELIATEHGVREPGGALAGTSLALDQAVRNLVEWTGCSVADGISTVTTVPARVLGLTTKGAVRVGLDADLVVLDRDLRVRATIVGGRLVDANMVG